MRSGRRLKIISLLLLIIVGSHNACSQFNSSNKISRNQESEPSELSSRNPLDKTQQTLAAESELFVSSKRITCHKTRPIERTIRYESAPKRWLLTTVTQRSKGALCELQKQYIENVEVFKASHLAVYNGELFKQFIPSKNAHNINEVVAVCKPQHSDLDIGHSKLSGLVISWNSTLHLWETRLDYTSQLESDHLTSQGPFGFWKKDGSLLIFNTSGTSAPGDPQESQRQKLRLELSLLSGTSTESSSLYFGVLNYSFKVYGNQVHEINDALITCWIDPTRLD